MMSITFYVIYLSVVSTTLALRRQLSILVSDVKELVMKTQKLTAVIMIGGMALGAAPAFANDNQDAPFKVFVAYADKGVHASNFLPSPWAGSPGVIFIGNHGSTGPYDAGAIRIHNSSTTDKLQVNGVEVDFYTAPLGPPGVASVLHRPRTLTSTPRTSP
jgi:hypothetical protein